MRASTLLFVLALVAALATSSFANGVGAADESVGAGPTVTPAPMESAPSSAEATRTTPTEPVPLTPTEPTPPVTTQPAPPMAVAPPATEFDALAVQTIARCYAMDPGTVYQLQSRGYTATDIAVLASLSARTGRPVSEFVQLRDQGMTWTDIANRYNVAMTDLMTPMAMMMSPEVNSYNRQFVSQYFGVSDSDINTLRSQGMDWGEIYMAANLSARTNQPITQIAGLRSQGLAWSDIGSRYNVTAADLTRPFVPVGRVAGVAEMVTPVALAPWRAPDGRVILTQRESERFRAMGYDWRSIVVAANISIHTGDSVEEILRMTNQGLTWPQIARSYGLNPDDVVDVTAYPFRRDEPLMAQPGSIY